MMCVPLVRSVAHELPQHVSVELGLPATLPCFAGHFPHFPVLAGVVQLDWVMQLAATHFPGVPRTAVDLRVKFKRVITPGSPLALTLRHDPERRRLDFTYRVDALIASQGQVTWPPP